MQAVAQRSNRRLAGDLLLVAAGFGAAFLAAGLARRRVTSSRFGDDPQAIDERVRVAVDGAELTMIVQGRSADLPVLLLLGGGPGLPGYLMECLSPTALAEHFIVAYPEYRGTGLSRRGDEDSALMDTERYLRDVDSFTDDLRTRFGQDRILLMGHSFGTYLGIQAASRHPEKYTAYVGMSELSDSQEMERAAHARMLDLLHARGDRMERKLRDFDLSDPSDYHRWTVSSARDAAMHALGGGTTHAMTNVITGIFLPSLRCRAYRPLERPAIWTGKFASHRFAVTKESREWRGPDSVTELDIPFYVFAGAHDLTTYFPHQRAYFDRVSAPVKGFCTFAESAHSPLYEEPELAIRILLDDVIGRSSDGTTKPRHEAVQGS